MAWRSSGTNNDEMINNLKRKFSDKWFCRAKTPFETLQTDVTAHFNKLMSILHEFGSQEAVPTCLKVRLIDQTIRRFGFERIFSVLGAPNIRANERKRKLLVDWRFALQVNQSKRFKGLCVDHSPVKMASSVTILAVNLNLGHVSMPSRNACVLRAFGE